MPITHHVAVSEGLHFACLHVHFVPKHSCCFCLLFLEARDSFFPCCPQGDGNCKHNPPAETCRFVFADSMWSAIIVDTWGHECRGKLWRLWFDTCCALVLCWKTCQFLKQQTKVFADLGPYFFLQFFWMTGCLLMPLSFQFNTLPLQDDSCCLLRWVCQINTCQHCLFLNSEPIISLFHWRMDELQPNPDEPWNCIYFLSVCFWVIRSAP